MFNELLLLLHHRSTINLRLIKGDAIECMMPLAMCNVCTADHYLGRYAADIHAGASDNVSPFDNGDLCALFCGFNGCGKRARSSADNRDL